MILKTTSDRSLQERRLAGVACWLIGVLGLIHAWGGRHFMNPDAVSYLDLAEAYACGDWAQAINSYWSPLYAWLLAAALAVLRPSAFWEFAVAHLVNLAIFLGTLACFEFFLRALTEWVEKAAVATGRQSLPKWPLQALGYTLFTWSSLDLIEVRQVTPDMLVASLVYLAAGLVLQSHCGNVNWSNAAVLGVVLGFGYLAKTAMLPVALVFVAAIATEKSPARAKLWRGLVVLVSFAAVAAPWVAALSVTKGHLTIGDAGKLNYCWFVDGKVSVFKNVPKTRLEEPAVLDYGPAARGTYPRRYDPSYWWAGIEPSFNLHKQADVLGRSVAECYKLFVERTGALLASAVVMWLLVRRRTAALRNALWKQAGIWIPAVAAIVMYGLVQFELRYVGAYVVLIWMSIFGGLWVAGAAGRRRLVELLAWGMVAVTSLTIAVSTCRAVGRGLKHAEPPQWRVAEELNALGLRAGDKVGYVGQDDSSFWARLAGVRIVAEMEARDEQWMLDRLLRSKVLQAFKASGVKAVVVHKSGGRFPKGEWRRLGRDDYVVFLVSQQGR